MSSTYDRLLDLILTNGIQVDEALTETKLAEKLHVSRTPVREALKLLEQDGFVERSGRSVRVKELGPEEILEIYEVRGALETAAARGAAQRRTDLDLSRLEAIHDEMLELPQSDVEAMATWNYRFHEAIWRASHNATLEGVITRLISRLRRHPQTTLSFPGRWERVLKEHEELIAAIRTPDPERAGAVAAEHMTRARDVRLRMYAKQTAGREE